MKYFQFSDAMIDWLRDNYPRLSVGDMAVAFNAKFGTDRTGEQLKGACKRRGIKCGRGTGDLARGKSKLLTPEQHQWLVDNYPLMRQPELVAALNAEFGADLKQSQIHSYVKNHKIRSGRTGHFGTRPGWNKGTKGVSKANAGSFKKGHAPVNRHPLYSERINRQGYIEIKIPERNPWNGQPTRYVPKHRWIWEQANGPVPSGHAVIFKDGDRLNITLDNLKLVTRAELSMMNILDHTGAPDELKPLIRTTAKLAVTASNPTRDPSITKSSQVLDSITERPKSVHRIAEETGIEYATVSSIVCILKRRGLVERIDTKTKAPSGRSVYQWRAA